MTRVSPFFANKGYHPSIVVEPDIQVSSTGAQCFIADLDDLHVELKQSIAKAQECYQKYADEHCSPVPPLKIGNQVYIKAKYFHTTQPLKKLSEKNLGPYEIIAIPGSHSLSWYASSTCPPTISNHLRLHPPTLWCHSDAHCVTLHNHATPRPHAPQPSPIISNSIHLHSGVTLMHTA